MKDLKDYLINEANKYQYYYEKINRYNRRS